MSITVEPRTDATLDGLHGEWNDLVDRSPMGSLFHRYEVLRVIEEHSDATLHPLVGYKGQEPVGIFPVFEVTKGPVTTVFSPPPGLGVPHLGPVLFNYEHLKQRRFEKRNLGFVESCLEWVASNLNPKYFHTVTQTAYDDVRPFQWNDFKTAPKYTYDLDITVGEEALLEGFARDARTAVTNTPEDAYVVEERGLEGLEYVLGRVNSRYDEGDGGLVLDSAYIEDLYHALPDASLLVYVLDIDGEPVSGNLMLHDTDSVMLWQGSPKPTVETDLNVNDILVWESIVDGIEAGKTTYSFVGANTPHISKYKAKFNPETNLYFEIERGTRTMNVVSDLYRRFR